MVLEQRSDASLYPVGAALNHELWRLYIKMTFGIVIEAEQNWFHHAKEHQKTMRNSDVIILVVFIEAAEELNLSTYFVKHIYPVTS